MSSHHFNPYQELPDPKPEPVYSRAATTGQRIVIAIMAAIMLAVLWVGALAVIWLTKAVLG